jgi:hypothetical protein
MSTPAHLHVHGLHRTQRSDGRGRRGARVRAGRAYWRAQSLLPVANSSIFPSCFLAARLCLLRPRLPITRCSHTHPAALGVCSTSLLQSILEHKRVPEGECTSRRDACPPQDG